MKEIVLDGRCVMTGEEEAMETRVQCREEKIGRVNERRKTCSHTIDAINLSTFEDAILFKKENEQDQP